MLALGEGEYRFDGVPAMRRRPMGELFRILRDQGCEVHCGENEDCIPFTIKCKGLGGGHIYIKADQTSQQISALLMVAPYAERDTIIDIEGVVVSKPYLEMTCRLMSDFGVCVSREGSNHFEIRAGQRYQPTQYTIEPDASNASYFFAAAALTGGRVRVYDLSMASCQGDVRFVELLKAMGCKVNSTPTYIEVIGPEKLLGIDADMNDISDTVPTLAAIAPFAASPVTIRNVEHIRGKETDRITAVTTELRRMGITIREFFGGFTIYPCTPAPAEIHTYNDHRMAMAFAVTGLRAPGIVIADPTCTAKTFPDFFDRFTQMASSGGA
jgi:3-phosphoshikimate 1-carboxyvinyltransferase